MTTRKNPPITSNFVKVPKEFISSAFLTPYEKLVLIYIIQFRQCYAGQNQIAKSLGLSRATVQRALSHLIEIGVIDKQHREGWSVFYFVRSRSKWHVPVAQ